MAELLLQAVLEFDLLEPPLGKHARKIREALDDRVIDGPRDAPDSRAVKRLFFEVVAFVAFVVMGLESIGNISRILLNGVFTRELSREPLH